MYLASDSQKQLPTEFRTQYPFHGKADTDFDLMEITDLADRFRAAHIRLNNIELELHETAFGTDDRMTLLCSLEEARMNYSDARFALSTLTIVSSKR